MLLPDVLITNFKRRVTGVSTTAIRVSEAKKKHNELTIGLCGPLHEIRLRYMLIGGWKRPAGRPFRIWHVRRDGEMMWGLFAKHILRQPIRLVFTSAQTKAHSRLPAWLIRQMDAVIATTPEAAAAREAQGRTPDLIQGHGVDTQVFQPSSSRPPRPLVLAQVGRIRREKGSGFFIDALCQVLPDFPEARVEIFGQAMAKDTTYAEGLKIKLQTAEVADQVHWHGEVDPDAFPDRLNQCHVLVAVPEYEGFGLTPFEGMACGLDLICTKTGALPTATDGGEQGALLDFGDLDALVAAIRTCLDSPDETLARGQQNRDRATQSFSIEREAAAITALYARLT